MAIETYEMKCIIQSDEWYMGYHDKLASYTIVWHSCKAFEYNNYYTICIEDITYCLKCKTQFPEIVTVTANLIR